MKKLLLCLVTLTLFSSCEPVSHRDMSLAGSVSFDNYFITAMGEYGGVDLGELVGYEEYLSSYLSIIKTSETEISLECLTTWADSETIFHITIPRIPLEGEPDDVYFDYSAPNATVIYNDIEYSPIDISVSGWITEKLAMIDTRSSADPYIPTYFFEIEIRCTLNNKQLDMIITPY